MIKEKLKCISTWYNTINSNVEIYHYHHRVYSLGWAMVSSVLNLPLVISIQYITNQMQQFPSLLSWRLFTAQHVSGVFRPSSGAQWMQWQPLVLPSYRGDSRTVFVVGPTGPTTNTARLSPRYEGKIRGCHCTHWAPDDRRENAGNMLSCN